MKIAAIIATRGNPRKAGAVIEVARAMSSERHELEFITACDTDDTKTTDWLIRQYGSSIRLSITDRPLGLGACFNRVRTDARIVMCMGDDGYPATPYWDEVIARHVEATTGPAAFAWHDLANPGQPTIICASAEWRSLAHPMLDERFPFWWADTAAAEVFAFATGRQMPVLPIVMANKPKANPNLRDMGFWWSLYSMTRRERLAKAAAIRAALGLPIPENLLEIMDACADRDLRGRSVVWPEPAKPPSDRYIAAKANAEAWMREAA